MQKFDTVILGSGYFSVGYALKSENALIIERTNLADPCFGGTLSGFEYNNCDGWHAETKNLHNFFVEKNIATEDRFNSSVSESGLCEYLKNRNVSYLLGSECIDVKNCDGGYVLTVINNSGHVKIYCKKLVDTHTAGVEDRLNVLCRGDSELFAKNRELSVTGAFEPSEFIVGFKNSDGVDINSVKATVTRYLEKAITGSDTKIVQYAYLMRKDAVTQQTNDWYYPDAFAAFDAGVKAALEDTV
jgi:hypothetical protein